MTTGETEFSASLGKVARRELAVHGLTQFVQLADWSEGELLDIHGVGPKAVRILRDELRKRDLNHRLLEFSRRL
jgi:predicted flap endonuclease-1-like 5' DNA nuclease